MSSTQDVEFMSGSTPLTLNPGWNLISLPRDSRDSIGQIFDNSEIMGTVWTWTNNSQNSTFARIGTDEHLSALAGYWIFSRVETIDEISGNAVKTADDKIELKTGWNLFGPSAEIVNPYNANIRGSIWCWNGSMFVDVDKLTGKLIVGKGYWLYSLTDQLYPP